MLLGTTFIKATPNNIVHANNFSQNNSTAYQNYKSNTLIFSNENTPLSSQNILISEELDDDENKEKIGENIYFISILLREAKQPIKLSSKAFAYFIANNETKKPVERYILYCSWKSFLA